MAKCTVILSAVSCSGYLLEVLVLVAKFVVSSVVAASVEGSVDTAGAEEDDVSSCGSVDTAGAEEDDDVSSCGSVDTSGAEVDDDVSSGGFSVGVTLQFRSEYISAL
jgi:hypothetical protein